MFRLVTVLPVMDIISFFPNKVRYPFCFCFLLVKLCFYFISEKDPFTLTAKTERTINFPLKILKKQL